MLAHTHVTFALCGATLLPEEFQLEGLEWAALIVGALAPDIDHGSATISRPGNLFRAFLPDAIVTLFNLVGTLFSRGIRLLFGHREFIHAPLLGLLLIFLSELYTAPLLFAFGFGYLTHLLGDLCTPEGIPVFAPVSRRKYSLSLFVTGGFIERLIFIALLVGALAYFAQRNSLLPLEA